MGLELSLPLPLVRDAEAPASNPSEVSIWFEAYDDVPKSSAAFATFQKLEVIGSFLLLLLDDHPP